MFSPRGDLDLPQFQTEKFLGDFGAVLPVQAGQSERIQPRDNLRGRRQLQR
ncbi:MAG: hypothetical protein ACXW31_06865 [Thermoanaerobaculia bacterium]